jgi:hypothetical protein
MRSPYQIVTVSTPSLTASLNYRVRVLVTAGLTVDKTAWKL